MRFGLSSASEASGDEGPHHHQLYPLQDLRTPAGRAGLKNPGPRRSVASPAVITRKAGPPTKNSSNTGSSGNAVASSSKLGLLKKSTQNGQKSSATTQQRTKWLPPWIATETSSSSAGATRDGSSPKTHQSDSSCDDDDDDDDDEDTEYGYDKRSRAGSVPSPQRRSRKSETPSRSLSSRPRPSSSQHRRKGLAASPRSSSSSSSSSGSGSSSSDDEGSQEEESTLSQLYPDTSDSEELEWPVGPSAGQQSGRRRGGGQRRTKRFLGNKEREILQRIRIASDEQAWDGEWGDAVRTTSLRWGNLVTRLSESPSIDHKAVVSKTGKTTPSRPLDAASDLDEVEATLSRLRLEKEETERRDRAQFEARERKLWSSIEEAIKVAETEASQRAQAEAARLAAARRAQEEAEKKAKAAREAEEAKIKAEAEAKEKAQAEAEADRKRQEEEERKLAEAEKLKESTKGMGGGDALRLQARQEYTEWTSKMKHIKEHILPVVSGNAQWRKQCFAAKRQITPKIGQLTNSKQEIARITSALSSLLNEAKAAPCPNQEIYTWVLNHLSKCLIRQAEQEVAVKLDTAYPLARVVVWLLLDGHSELSNVLMARLVKKSCWCLGYVPPKTAEYSDEAAYAKAVGRASLEETSVQFSSRQAGIVAFYFAICQTPPQTPTNARGDLEAIPRHFRPSALWTWQARCITPPMTRHAIVPALWATMVEVAGDRVLRIYGRQAAKVWTLLYQVGIMQGQAEFVKLDEGKAASGRLQLLLEDWKKNGGKAEALKGREMDA